VLLDTINLSEALFFFLVLYPRAGLPHGVTGEGIPIEVLPPPPPCGWSQGFITDPLTVGLIPICLFLPALPITTLPCSMLPTCPIVALQSIETNLISPDGNLNKAFFPSLAIN